ncbi:unnamed protein product [Effrenium voratum]|nr:unnamed protein product [Effrenium voratum]
MSVGFAPAMVVRLSCRHLARSKASMAPTPAANLRVSSQQVQAYRENGVVHLPQLFGPDWVQYLREAFGQGMQRPGKYAEFISKDSTWETLFENAQRKNVGMFQDQVFYEEAVERLPDWVPVFHSHAAAVIAQLMGSATVSFFYLHAILKRGGSTAIPWHQDLPYWKVDGKQIGSVWIALDDMPLAASVRYVQGSHAWGLFRPRHFVDHSPYAGRDELPELPDVETMLRAGEANALSFEVKAGDALCFDSRIVHGSPGHPEADGPEQRRVALRFGGDDAIYCDRAGETAIPTPEIDATHSLQHGDPLSCKEPTCAQDPLPQHAFPRVWP